ncbi:phosphatidylethanolamine N-methyltransferase family protein [Candidatus Woesearchaeota archaeon]|nr:phosphatidylethanolamine N-methyltransferase family protein [Candidatus Woesearchaeota archaeon]MCF7900848.1 phosphatidylethanolamine N-methyltransferase family protein [Candidatus Woesearchaeota archaeon]MCF8013830.1 phosphatidylethanolamine N-methyltransferase family protein [Candidatus Woesearchaeota archaeon]
MVNGSVKDDNFGFFNFVWKFILILVGMMGIRLDRGRVLFVWIPLVGLSYWLNHLVFINGWWLPYAVFSWFFYYVGNSLILGTSIHLKMIKRFGEKKAYSIYEVILGLMFVNIGFGVVQFIAAHQNSMQINELLVLIVSVVVFIVSFGSKFWATWLVGLDIYYYKDLFLNKKVGVFINSGPYKIFKNPMYGIGNVYGYLGALSLQSLEGLIFMGFCHISIFVFNYVVEKPFVRRMYGSN